MLGASLSTSSRIGIGKEEPFAYDIYELEFLPEKLFGSTYRRSLTSIFPEVSRRDGEGIMPQRSKNTVGMHSGSGRPSSRPEN